MGAANDDIERFGCVYCGLSCCLLPLFSSLRRSQRRNPKNTQQNINGFGELGVPKWRQGTRIYIYIYVCNLVPAPPMLSHGRSRAREMTVIDPRHGKHMNGVYDRVPRPTNSPLLNYARRCMCRRIDRIWVGRAKQNDGRGKKGQTQA
jgi:hypothetical protein